jgi:hypothetical protein
MSVRKLFFILLFITGCSVEKSGVNVGELYLKHGTLAAEPAREPQKGFDVLALAMIDPKMVVDAADSDYAIGVLDGTFGDIYPHLKIVLDSGKFTYVRLHLWDHTCYRGNKCPNSPWTANSDGPIKERAAKFVQFMAGYPGIKYGLSPVLEHDQKGSGIVNHWFEIIRSVAPKAELVCSAFTGYCPSGVQIEKHGNENKGDVTSNDGSSIFDSNSVIYRTNGRKTVLAWFYECNLRFAGEKVFTDPLRRRCRPTYDLFAQAKLILRAPAEPAPFPRDCQIKRDIKAPETLKTNAESYCAGDVRDNRPLYITTISGTGGQRLSVYNSKGTRIGCFQYYGPYTDHKLSRWYSGTCNNLTPTGYYRASGEWAFIKRRVGNRTECTRFNTIRRLGTYR